MDIQKIGFLAIILVLFSCGNEDAKPSSTNNNTTNNTTNNNSTATTSTNTGTTASTNKGSTTQTNNTTGGQTTTGATNQADKTPPVITLVGDKAMVLKQYDVFSDPGASAEDDVDGVVAVSVSGMVNTMAPGEYTLTYKAADKAGNKSELTRKVEIEIRDFTKKGPYEFERVPKMGLTDNDYVFYFPKNNITPNMPVVLFLEGGGGSKITNYRGIMKYMATQGYFVIGAESGGSYDSDFGRKILERALDAAIQSHQLTVSKLVVMGHSLGGGAAFYVLRYFQKDGNGGYGKQGSLGLSIDGWFAFSMNKSDVAALKGDISFIQMNGLLGTGTDPRIDLTIMNLADKTGQTFFTLPSAEHGYVGGELDDLLRNKGDLLIQIGALTHRTFFPNNNVLSAIPAANTTTYADIYRALKPKDSRFYNADCKGRGYNALPQLILYDIDYCSPKAP